MTDYISKSSNIPAPDFTMSLIKRKSKEFHDFEEFLPYNKENTFNSNGVVYGYISNDYFLLISDSIYYIIHTIDS